MRDMKVEQAQEERTRVGKKEGRTESKAAFDEADRQTQTSNLETVKYFVHPPARKIVSEMQLYEPKVHSPQHEMEGIKRREQVTEVYRTALQDILLHDRRYRRLIKKGTN